VDSGRERVEIFANAQELIVSADLSGTQRAKTLNILKEPELAAEAAAAFRDAIGTERVLTRVGIDKKTVAFGTNIPDKSRIVTSSMPVTQTFTWDLNGLQRRLRSIDVPAQTGTASPSFGIGDVDWRILSKLQESAIAKADAPKSLVTHVGIAAATDQPGQPVLLWTIEVTDAEGETTRVMADMKGTITRVMLPQSRRPKIDWREPAALAGAIARIGSVFGQNAKIASIVANDREARVTIEDPMHGGQPATFEFSADGVSRATISFSLEAMGPRFGVAELAAPERAQACSA
jgi:hypothetical protein